jgi:hypothetical protein
MERENAVTLSLGFAVVCLVSACSGAAPGSVGTTSEQVGQSAAAVTVAGATLDADFTHCTEYAGLASVPLANVAGLVPAPYVPASYGPGLAGFILRTAHCEGASVNGGPSHEGTVLQIGVNIVPPNNTGNINNYTVYYLTTSHALAEGLRRVGIRAEEDPFLILDAKTSATGQGHVFLFNGFEPAPPLVIDSPTLSPTPATTPIDFIAEWWQAGAHEELDMYGTYPGILFGANSPNVSIHVPPGSPLAHVIGGTSLTFNLLSVENEIPASHLHASAVAL